jgi:hypothetical protein
MSETNNEHLPESKEYDPEQDPKWEYQGRSPQRMASQQAGGTIVVLVGICFALAVAAWFIPPHIHVLGR